MFRPPAQANSLVGQVLSTFDFQTIELYVSKRILKAPQHTRAQKDQSSQPGWVYSRKCELRAIDLTRGYQKLSQGMAFAGHFSDRYKQQSSMIEAARPRWPKKEIRL